MCDVVLAPGKVIVDAEYVVAASKQALAQMRAEKPRAPGDEDTLGYDAGHEKGLWLLMPFGKGQGQASACNCGRAICAGRPMLT